MARVQLNVWVESSERDAIKARAAEAGVPVGRLVVEAVLGAPVRRDPAVEVSAAVERVAVVETAQEGFERRLSRLEEMAGL